jgi:hypothetical protein
VHAVERVLAAPPSLQARVVVLGGAFYINGNVNPAAEANIFGDPDAANVVFSRWVGLLRCFLHTLAASRLPQAAPWLRPGCPAPAMLRPAVLACREPASPLWGWGCVS